jgi:hypothetical protein
VDRVWSGGTLRAIGVRFVTTLGETVGVTIDDARILCSELRQLPDPWDESAYPVSDLIRDAAQASADRPIRLPPGDAITVLHTLNALKRENLLTAGLGELRGALERESR